MEEVLWRKSSVDPRIARCCHFSLLRIVILLAAAACFSVSITEGKKSSKTIVRIEQFANCPNRPNTTEYFKNHNYLTDVRIERVKVDQFINADYVVNRPVHSIHANILMLACETTSASSCEKVLNMKMPNLCGLLLDKNAIYTPLLESITPAMKCPVTKPRYMIRNGTFSTASAMQYIPHVKSSAQFFGAEFTYGESNRAADEVGCMYILFRYYTVRVKS